MACLANATLNAECCFLPWHIQPPKAKRLGEIPRPWPLQPTAKAIMLKQDQESFDGLVKGGLLPNTWMGRSGSALMSDSSFAWPHNLMFKSLNSVSAVQCTLLANQVILPIFFLFFLFLCSSNLSGSSNLPFPAAICLPTQHRHAPRSSAYTTCLYLALHQQLPRWGTSKLAASTSYPCT